MKHISVNFLQNSFIDMIRKMRIRYVKKYINPCVETQKSKEFSLRISSKTIFSRISSRLEKSGGKSSNFVRTSREQSVSKVRFASSSHGFLFSLPFFFFFLPSPSIFPFPSSPSNTCCTRHRGREIDFAVPDIRRQGRGSSCDFPSPRVHPFSPRIPFVRNPVPPFNPLRKPNHDPQLPLPVSAFSDYPCQVGREVAVNSGEIASLEAGQRRDNPRGAPLLRMKRSGIEPGRP